MSRLTEIFEHKRLEVVISKQNVSFPAIRIEAAEAEPPRGFLRALEAAGPRIALIAEVKRASPSMGIIRDDFDPLAIGRAYEASGANALSVLTDEKYFHGKGEYLRQIKVSVALPCLRKDFIDDPYQVFEARAWGADAILLILAALDDSLARDLMALSTGLGMDTLVEVHTEKEGDRAMKLGATMVGVNNRSLVDFSTDLRTAETLLPQVEGAFRIAESALYGPEDVKRMRDAGADGVLIGTAFCAKADIKSGVKEVMGW